ncbi:MAG: hypothetical protein GY851_33185, partial [bacterium]|nr:hypothetical protein [bacterium]
MEPRVDHAAAVRMFERRRFGWVRRLLGGRRAVPAQDGQTPRQLPYAELVWVPAYLITIGLRTRRGPAEVSCTVEGHGGAFAIFGLHDALREGTPDATPIPPELSAEGAELVARKELVHTIMRLRGGRRKSVPE